MSQAKDREPADSDSEAQRAHPVEPAEGAREPGEDANAPLPRHPSQPAEGEREPDDERGTRD